MEQLLLESLKYSTVLWVFLSLFKEYLHYSRLFKLSSLICNKCFTFWITLILTWSLPIAAIAALMAHIIDSQLNNTKL